MPLQARIIACAMSRPSGLDGPRLGSSLHATVYCIYGHARRTRHRTGLVHCHLLPGSRRHCLRLPRRIRLLEQVHPLLERHSRRQCCGHAQQGHLFFSGDVSRRPFACNCGGVQLSRSQSLLHDHRLRRNGLRRRLCHGPQQQSVCGSL